MKYQLLPDLKKQEYEALRNDIKKRGVLVPIECDEEGNILDGHHRHKIAVELDIPFKTIVREFKTEQEKREHVIKLNLCRRHLEPHEWGMAFEKLLEERGVCRGAGKRSDLTTSATIAEVSDEVGVPERTAYHRLAQADTYRSLPIDEKEQVDRGETTISKVAKEIKRKEKIKDVVSRAELPESKYRVVYADPPWEYSSSKLDEYGPAERHYPTMSIEKLCSLDVGSIVDPDAVLFLWVTSPLLAECWSVISAWGFEYKTSFVWDKVKHNYGHYNSVRHEFLLICTRGSCVPDNNKLFNSVQRIERTDKHSEKPETFREIIDTMYPYGKRIELFARNKFKGWDNYGNEL